MEEQLKDQLFKSKKIGWEEISNEEKETIYNYSQEYINFLNKAKTEREFIAEAKKEAESKTYHNSKV